MIFFSYQFWNDSRWADPSDPKDLMIMTEKFTKAQTLHNQLKNCSIDLLLDALMARSSPCSKSDFSDHGESKSAERACQSANPSVSPPIKIGLPPVLPRLETLRVVSLYLGPPFNVISHVDQNSSRAPLDDSCCAQRQFTQFML